ncbi:cation:proton antiporter [Phenylobacterium montanum]|uniref:Sodium:proton antiporter n=1 Tax=Phenylobacterium montanum TaxID=2823693 RepID=A0A975IVY8_9CAUL|nr:sodium:proton antiporter [Caulobacter sp. S6]QUD89507.1 sodium:proton antiporter [Caulobacter sp. S6]
MTGAFDISPLDAAAILVVLAATLAYLNHRYLGLPQAAGLTAIGAVASMAVVGIDRLLPQSHLGQIIVQFVGGIDFHTTLMDGMLSFLLFAGALHVDWGEMRRGRWAILTLSTFGVLLSALIVGAGFYLVLMLFGLAAPFVWCVVFGALISPTDPVAVMGVLKEADVSPALKAAVAGESLFNDGVGVVLFSIVLTMALGSGPFSAIHAVKLFMLEAGGGALLGLAVGWLAFQAMRSIDDYSIEVMLSLAVVMGGYALSHWLHVSGPVAMAVAGLLIGNHGVTSAMSQTTRDYLLKFWTLIDEILNAVLFLLIGLVVVTIPASPGLLLAGAASIPLALAARTISVLLPMAAMRQVAPLGVAGSATLIWGGLRGGISIALALGLSNVTSRSAVLTATYMVVIFSVIVQGASLKPLLERLTPRAEPSK